MVNCSVEVVVGVNASASLKHAKEHARCNSIMVQDESLAWRQQSLGQPLQYVKLERSDAVVM